MKYFKIGYDCGCGNNEDYITAKGQKELESWLKGRDLDDDE